MDDLAAACKAMEGVEVINGFGCNMSCSSYKILYGGFLPQEEEEERELVDGMDAFTVKQACKFAREYALKNGPIVRNDEPEKLKEDHCLRTEQGDCNQKETTSLCRNNQACNDDTFVSPSGNCRGGSNLIPLATEAQAAAPGLLIKWQT
ncbi:thiamine diphosphate-binding fold protein [Raphanus sativus]|nr:thiamine diphosphate-binding fold protein [Raphanus sativus]